MTHDELRALYVISVAAELAGMHPQTLRIYERRGLLTPARTTGGNRRYSDADIARLLRITELAATGMNLEGIRHVMTLEAEVIRLRSEVEQLRQGLMHAIAEIESRSRSNIVPVRQAMARFGERPSIFDPNR
ncbi:MAG: heat shock protein transcriptional repressor HspR [Ilumatobacteraceae bacterium]|jgi:MerR family transcriptional regulator/heat shock protein HspR